MRQLVSAKEIEELVQKGEKEFYIDEDTIITSSAKDAAKLNNIAFKNKNETASDEKIKSEEFDTDMIYKVCKAMMEKGMLNGKDCSESENDTKLFDSESDKDGLKIVRGNTVKMDVFPTGDPNGKAYYQELVSKEESNMSAGFLVIEKGRFNWKLDYEELDYVIEGTLHIEINGKTFVGYPGDVLFVPSGSKVVWGSPDRAKLFYTTYPANWEDLL